MISQLQVKNYKHIKMNIFKKLAGYFHLKRSQMTSSRTYEFFIGDDDHKIFVFKVTANVWIYGKKQNFINAVFNKIVHLTVVLAPYRFHHFDATLRTTPVGLLVIAGLITLVVMV